MENAPGVASHSLLVCWRNVLNCPGTLLSYYRSGFSRDILVDGERGSILRQLSLRIASEYQVSDELSSLHRTFPRCPNA